MLVGAVAMLSAFVKNIGALAMMIPIAMQMAKRSNRSPSMLLMPMAFGSLLGGTMTLIGTSPNIIVSRLRSELLGEPFGMFDFTPVGLGLTAAGLLFLVLGYRLLPQDRKGAPALGEAIDIKDYVTEARVKEDSDDRRPDGQRAAQARGPGSDGHCSRARSADGGAVAGHGAAGRTTSCCCRASRLHSSARSQARIWSWKARIAPVAPRRSRRTRSASSKR